MSIILVVLKNTHTHTVSEVVFISPVTVTSTNVISIGVVDMNYINSEIFI